MMKSCVVLDGVIINVGEWDYQYYVDENEKRVASNPFPKDATIEEREMEYSEERGWYEVDTLTLPTDKERIDMLENIILLMMEG